MNTININLKTIKNSISVGRQFDHNITKLHFEGLEPNVSYQLLIDLEPYGTSKPTLISLVNDEWLISNTYTQNSGVFPCQLLAFVNNEWKQYSQIFSLILDNSLGNGVPKEDIPPRFETKFNDMVNLINQVQTKLNNGEFNGESAYELAIKNGYKGTEQEWLESLKYQHSVEFSELAKQVRLNAQQVSNDKLQVNTDKAQVNNDKLQVSADKTQVSQDKQQVEAKVLEVNNKALQVSQDKVHIDNVVRDFDAKVTQTNIVIDDKVKQASDSANLSKQSADSVSASASQIDKNKDDIIKINDNLDIYFKMQRTGKLYGVKKWKADINPTSTCDKIYDNKGLVCEPSTDTIEGRDDYEDISLFKWQRVNYKRYDDGFAYPVAWEGEANYNDKDNADVGNIYQTFYYNEIDKGDYTELLISDSPNEALDLRPWEEAVRADGTVMPYFIMSAYDASLGSDGLLHSLPNRIIEAFMSHNKMITDFQKKGKGYWGAGSNRFTFAQIFSQIKYGTKDIQSVMQGCTGYSWQYKASIQSATKSNAFPLTKEQAKQVEVGSRMSVGYGRVDNGTTINLDRSVKSIHQYADQVVVLKIEDMADGVNSLVHLDCEPFDTTPINDPSGKQLDITLTSMPWHSGTTDNVIGHHDGSLKSNTNMRMPCRIQGIEYFCGKYIIASDTVAMIQSDMSRDIYFAPRGVAHSPNDNIIKQTYTKIGTIPVSKDGKVSDYWIGNVGINQGVWYPKSELVTQNSYKDRLYFGGNATAGSREYLQGGYLGAWSSAGLSCLLLWGWLDGAGWDCASAD